jgi:hypothetical protein
LNVFRSYLRNIYLVNIFTIFGPSQTERGHWEDDVAGWTILKWILERWDGADWIDMTQIRDQWRALLNTVLNLWVP